MKEVAADRWLVFYYEQMKGYGGLGAQDPVEDSGEVFADSCRECGDPEAFARLCKDAGAWVCNSCGEPWKITTEYRFVGEVRTAPRKGAVDDRCAKRFDLGVQFEEFTTDKDSVWAARYYVANCLEYSIRELIELGQEVWGEGAPTTMWGVRKLIDEGRENWTERLRKIGIRA